VKWNCNPSFPLAAAAIEDPRVSVLQEDVGDVIRRSPRGFDSIILDVDNSPAALSNDGNNRLYELEGLQLARGALRPGGCIGYWSAVPDPAFEKLMRRAGFEVDAQRCRPRANSGGWHTLFIGRVAAHARHN
jgi:spermidine synthase